MARSKTITVTKIQKNNRTTATIASGSESFEAVVVDGKLVTDEHITNPGVFNDVSK